MSGPFCQGQSFPILDNCTTNTQILLNKSHVTAYTLDQTDLQTPLVTA